MGPCLYRNLICDRAELEMSGKNKLINDTGVIGYPYGNKWKQVPASQHAQ